MACDSRCLAQIADEPLAAGQDVGAARRVVAHGAAEPGRVAVPGSGAGGRDAAAERRARGAAQDRCAGRYWPRQQAAEYHRAGEDAQDHGAVAAEVVVPAVPIMPLAISVIRSVSEIVPGVV